MEHLISTFKNAYFQKAASIYWWVVGPFCLPHSIHTWVFWWCTSSRPKKIRRLLQFTDEFLDIVASFTQVMHEFFDAAPHLDPKKCILWEGCSNLLMNIWTFLPPSLNLYMSFLMVHLISTLKNAYFRSTTSCIPLRLKVLKGSAAKAAAYKSARPLGQKACWTPSAEIFRNLKNTEDRLCCRPPPSPSIA